MVNENDYKLSSNGTSYKKDTPDELIGILETLRNKGRIVRIFYGDSKTGMDWNEEHDTIGRIGRSTGSIRIPLLVASGESGGPGLLDNCIVKIMYWTGKEAGKVIWKHPNYYNRKFTWEEQEYKGGYKFLVKRDGEEMARFKSLGPMFKYITFMSL